MKSILYAGAALMIGASIYGFVDYRHTHKKKGFKEMYAEKKTEAPVAVATTDEPVTSKEIAVTEKTKPAVSKKMVAVKAKEADPVQPIAGEEKLVTEKKAFGDAPAVTVEPSQESSALKTVKKKRKLKKELFSRAPLRDEEEVLIESVKEKVKKTESKEL